MGEGTEGFDIPVGSVQDDPPVPKQGSDEAVIMGCTCPVLDNAHGQGIVLNGVRCFWTTTGCPVHWPEGGGA